MVQKIDNGKKRFWGSVTSYVIGFLVASCYLALGIALALTSAKLDIGGKVKFVATDIHARISGTVTGTQTANVLNDINLDSETKDTETWAEWTNLVLDFDDAVNNVVVTIKIENLSDDRSIGVSFTDSISSANTTITRAVNGTTTSSFSNIQIAESATKTITITMKIADRNKSVDGDFGLLLSLVSFSQEEETTTVANDFTVTYSGDNATITKPTNSSLTTADIPSYIYNKTENKRYKVTEIAASAFENCTSLTSVTIPNTIEAIRTKAFYKCTGLTTIVVPDSVTHIESRVFEYCQKVAGLTLSKNLASLGDYAFKGMTALKSFTLPAKVTTLPSHALQDTKALERLEVDSANATYYSENNCIITKSSKNLVRGCKGSVIPSGVLSIYSNSFEGSGIVSVEIPNTVKIINTWAFNGCRSLTAVTIPESLTSIQARAFNGCTALTSAKFAVTTGWTAGETALESSKLSVASTAAEYLRGNSSGDYVTVKWTRA